MNDLYGAKHVKSENKSFKIRIRRKLIPKLNTLDAKSKAGALD